MCMYRAGPHLAKTYMSYDDLADIAEFIKQLAAAGIGVEVNFVGGEPTLNLGEFSRCITQLHGLLVDEEKVSYEMTTNGWWLRSWGTTLKFMKALRDSRLLGGISIRISESDFHKPHRGQESELVELLAKQKGGSDDLVFEMVDRWNSQERDAAGPVKFTCNACDTENSGEDSECSECGVDCDEERYEAIDNLPGHRERDMHGWMLRQLFGGEGDDGRSVHVDVQHGDQTVPVGRALDLSIGTKGGGCHKYDNIKFTFEPGGKLHDPCCNGGHAPLGHARDGWLLFMRRIAFMESLHSAYPGGPYPSAGTAERCRNCALHAAKWLSKPVTRRDSGMVSAARAIAELENDDGQTRDEYFDSRDEDDEAARYRKGDAP